MPSVTFVLNIGVMWWFLRLHLLRTERFILEHITSQYWIFLICDRLPIELFKLLLSMRLGDPIIFMNHMANSILMFGSMARNDLFKETRLIYDGYFISKCVAMEIRDMERTTEEEIEEIGKQGSTKRIKLNKLRVFGSIMKGHLAKHLALWTEKTEVDSESQSTHSEDGELQELQIIHRLTSFLLSWSRQVVQLMQRGLSLPNHYWKRHCYAVKCSVTLLLPIVELEIVKLEKVYVDLSLSQAEEDRSSGRHVFVMDRHYMGFLDRLPRGLFFWLRYDWEEGWTEAIAVFGRGYIMERDIRIWSEFSHQIDACRTRLASR